MISAQNLASIAGAENVKEDEATLKQYSSDMSFVQPIKPRYVVKVHSTEDIQKLVRLGRGSLTPLIPVSSGAPHFRGDTVPGTAESIIVDLSEMKKIIMVDRKNRSIMFEPGVTFGELIKATAKKGLRLNLPLLPRRSKSVVGSLLEREPVVMPKYHWDIGDPTNCFEVVFGTGDLFRTGAAAGPGTIEEQWAAGGAQKEAAGPSSSSWYRVIQGSQGTMGIVSWATARCELIPSLEQPYMICSDRVDNLLDMVHWLVRLRLVNECFILNRLNLAIIMSGKERSIESLKRKIPQWVLFFNIAAYEYLPELRINGQTEDMKKIVHKAGLEPVEGAGGITADDILEKVQQPSKEPYWKLRDKGACQDIFFLTTYDCVPGLVETMAEIAKKCGYETSGMGIYLQPVVQGASCHCEFNIYYDPDSAEQAEKVRNICLDAPKSLMDRGAFFSRPYGETAGTIMNRDFATVAALHKVKSILDPDKIMNPGKLCF
ncbi:MAG: FAD-binding oxidoreductase [Dehalococcoidales bacterium]|nr:FAD-binding oxidoreductase [Dehalococcoidales bacterium]